MPSPDPRGIAAEHLFRHLTPLGEGVGVEGKWGELPVALVKIAIDFGRLNGGLLHFLSSVLAAVSMAVYGGEKDINKNKAIAAGVVGETRIRKQ